MEIKFELGEMSNHPHIPVYVNGEGPFIFTLDTGAVTSTISKSVATKLGIETYQGEKKEARGLGGPVPIEFAKVREISIGSESLEDEELAVLDFDAIFGPDLPFTDGLIGHSFLKHYKMTINYDTSIFSLERVNDNVSQSSDGIKWTDFTYYNAPHLVNVPTMINGEGPFPLVIDTGSGGTVLTPELAEKLNLQPDESGPLIKVVSSNEEAEGCVGECRGIGGAVPGYPARVDRLEVGGVSQENFTAAIIDFSSISPDGEMDHHGIIGYPFLKDFELVIDYPNTRFAFLPK